MSPLSFEKATAFMNIAKSIASNLSKDDSTKVGFLILSADNSPLTWGYNGFPRGVKDDVPERKVRPEKYKWTEHAERNALYNATRHGISLMNSKGFLPELCPCIDCTRGLIQSGMREIYIEVSAIEGDGESQKRWREDFSIVQDMLVESGAAMYALGNDRLYNII